jgi:predicted SnoaL-like aldol condensation-catalyzing enzyme
MSTEQNKAIIRRYYEEVLNAGNVDALQELTIAEYDEHDPLPVPDVDQIVAHIYATAFGHI